MPPYVTDRESTLRETGDVALREGPDADRHVRGPQRWWARRRLPRVSAAVDRFVRDRPATADTILAAPAPLRPIDLTDDAQVAEVLDLAVRMGEVVLSSGAAVIDTTTTVRFIAATYGLSVCDVDVTYDAIHIYVHRGSLLPPASALRVVHYRSLDFTRLAAVDRLTRQIREQVVPVGEARMVLDKITSAPHPYNRWFATLGWSLLAAAVTVIMGGGPLVIGLSFATTAVIDRVNRYLGRLRLPPFFLNVVGGVIAAAPAILLVALARPLGIQVDTTLVIAAGITVLLSGLSLVGAVQDALTGAPVTAAGRMFELLMLTGGVIAGIALCFRAADLFHVMVPPVNLNAIPTTRLFDLPIVEPLAAALASGAFALACYAERRALAAAAISGGVGSGCYLLLHDNGFGPVISAGVAATLVGLAGGLLARRALTPPLVVAVAGISPLLPGMSVYRGLYGLLENQLALGAHQLLSAFGTGCALAAGVTLGEWCDRTVRRPRMLRKFGGLRRPVVRRIRTGAPVNLRKRVSLRKVAGPADRLSSTPTLISHTGPIRPPRRVRRTGSYLESLRRPAIRRHPLHLRNTSGTLATTTTPETTAHWPNGEHHMVH